MLPESIINGMGLLILFYEPQVKSLKKHKWFTENSNHSPSEVVYYFVNQSINKHMSNFKTYDENKSPDIWFPNQSY